MRPFFFKCLAIVLFGILTACSAVAQDATGNWKIDRERFAADMQRMMEPQMAAVPPEMRPQMVALMQGAIDDILKDIGGTIEFLPDGRINAVDGDGEQVGGSWSQDGAIVTVVPDDEPEQMMRGPVDGDSMRLRSVQQQDMPIELVLLRQ